MQISAPDARRRTAAGDPNPNCRVRPVAAHLLLLFFSAMLLLPLLPAGAVQAGLAACCKRYGKHLCVGASDVKLTGASSHGHRISERCPFAFAHAFTGIAPTYGPTAAIAAYSGNAQHALGQNCTYSLPCLPARHSNPKRGPPALFDYLPV